MYPIPCDTAGAGTSRPTSPSTRGWPTCSSTRGVSDTSDTTSGRCAQPSTTLLELLACDDDDLTCLFENARPLAGAQARCIALIHSAGMYRGS